ncbi:MAG: hypothetical protein AAF530_21270 [Pseudomonadota bacterium]
MKLTWATALSLVSALLASSVQAGNFDGTICWTGTIETMATSQKDRIWAWKGNWTWVATDGNPETVQSGVCVGTGAMMDGEPIVPAHYCIHRTKSGAQFLSIATPEADGSNTQKIFGGTKEFAGVTGNWTGSPVIVLPAPDGEIAGCRKTSGEYKLAN